MPTETFDVHGVEPVPARDRTSSSGDQFWIWMGANIAPINWVLGTLGITLGLSLVETLVVIAAGNALGCAVFGLFCVMGHRTWAVLTDPGDATASAFDEVGGRRSGAVFVGHRLACDR